MQTLREWQRAMRARLFAGEPAVTESLAPDVSADRLDIYRNTIFSGLTRALRLAYPVVERLVGTEFFDGAADIFIRTHLPRAAYLDQYGDTFPAFLQSFTPAASLPYLADVARLEWAVNGALHAADETPLELAQLATVGAEDQGCITFRARASIRLLRTHYPADAIWRAVLNCDDEGSPRSILAPGRSSCWSSAAKTARKSFACRNRHGASCRRSVPVTFYSQRSKRVGISTRHPRWPSISLPAVSSPSLRAPATEQTREIAA